jgi:hypothetical protein
MSFAQSVGFDRRNPMVADQMWERACSRKRCVSQYQPVLSRRFREQARSHIESVPNRKI